MAAQKDQITVVKRQKKVTPQYLPQGTLQYKTFIKRTISEALQNAFARYADKMLSEVKAGPGYTTDRADFPSIVVKFYEKTLKNAGIGHVEWGKDEVIKGNFIEYHHTMYTGDVSLEVYGLSSPDRDKVADALVEIISMGTVGVEGKTFQERIYDTIGTTPYSDWHFITVNTDLVSGFGEQEKIAPWMPEDVFVYMCEYRIPIMGEFYSITPKEEPGSTGLVSEVDIYPYVTEGLAEAAERVAGEIAPKDFPEEQIPDEDYIKIVADDDDEVEL